jgi:LAS superfamily LD-carboxypeptidase LdcB
VTELSALDGRFRPYAERFILMLRYNGYQVQVTSTRRTRSQQRKLYREYVAGRRTLPAAPPGHSLHEAGLAFDAVISPSAGQSLAGSAWERLGGKWGGKSDPVHFQARVS